MNSVIVVGLSLDGSSLDRRFAWRRSPTNLADGALSWCLILFVIIIVVIVVIVVVVFIVVIVVVVESEIELGIENGISLVLYVQQRR